MSKYVNIQRGEYVLAGKTEQYDPLKTIYQQLFVCPKEGCLFKNLYWSEYKMHVRDGTHYYRQGE